jgi:hypothetical protein
VSTVELVGGVGSPQNGFEVTASTERALIGSSRELRVVPSEKGERAIFQASPLLKFDSDIGTFSIIFYTEKLLCIVYHFRLLTQ